MLAHFKPFSPGNPLINNMQTMEETYKNYSFDPFSCEMMANWEAVHECEDAQDAECINKHNQLTKESHIMKQTLHSVLENDWELDIENSFQEKSFKNLKIMTHLQLLENSNWFTEYQTHPHIIYAQSTQPNYIPDITSVCIK